jgi:hypothetical protein
MRADDYSLSLPSSANFGQTASYGMIELTEYLDQLSREKTRFHIEDTMMRVCLSRPSMLEVGAPDNLGGNK